jgi:xanthine/uracil permease
MMHAAKNESTVGSSLEHLSGDLARLVRGELASTVADITGQARRAGKGVGVVTLGATIAYTGWLAILASLVEMLTTMLPRWLSSLLVGLVMATIGASLVRAGLDLLNRAGVGPRQLDETLDDMESWSTGHDR